MVKKRRSAPHTIQNRRARYDYELSDSLIVGLALNGREVRSLRIGRGQLLGAFVTVKDNELWLINATIAGSSSVPIPESEQTRARKILAKKREIAELVRTKQFGRTIIPLEILAAGRYIKLRIAIGKGKKKYDKRQVLKQREASRRVRAVR